MGKFHLLHWPWNKIGHLKWDQMLNPSEVCQGAEMKEFPSFVVSNICVKWWMWFVLTGETIVNILMRWWTDPVKTNTFNWVSCIPSISPFHLVLIHKSPSHLHWSFERNYKWVDDHPVSLSQLTIHTEVRINNLLFQFRQDLHILRNENISEFLFWRVSRFDLSSKEKETNPPGIESWTTKSIHHPSNNPISTPTLQNH